MWRHVAQCKYWNLNYITFQSWFTIGLFSKYTKNVNIREYNAFQHLIKALQALHDTPPLCLFLLLCMFWHKNINVSTRFYQIHQVFHKRLNISIILKSIKGHNSVEKFEKIMYISHNMDHIWASSWENLFLPYANNKGADQPAHPHSLISTFVVRCLLSLVSISEISRL